MFHKIKTILLVLVIACGSGAFAAEPHAMKPGGKRLSMVMVPAGVKSGSPDDGVFQDSRTALEERKIRVLFEGRPLADAEITLFTESGWQKSFRTDAAGEVAFIPIVASNQKVVESYSASYRDPAGGGRHVSDISIDFAKPPPEWMQKAEGFLLWALAGAGLVVAFIGMTMYTVMKRDKKEMRAFAKYKVGKI
jgi:hypothetical protein